MLSDRHSTGSCDGGERIGRARQAAENLFKAKRPRAEPIAPDANPLGSTARSLRLPRILPIEPVAPVMGTRIADDDTQGSLHGRPVRAIPPSSANNDDGAGGMADDLLSDASDEKTRESSVPAAADDEQICVPIGCEVEDAPRRITEGGLG